MLKIQLVTCYNKDGRNLIVHNKIKNNFKRGIVGSHLSLYFSHDSKKIYCEKTSVNNSIRHKSNIKINLAKKTRLFEYNFSFAIFKCTSGDMEYDKNTDIKM